VTSAHLPPLLNDNLDTGAASRWIDKPTTPSVASRICQRIEGFTFRREGSDRHLVP
jgi:hypothetical protein